MDKKIDTHSISQSQFRYFATPIEAKGHSAIYKMHKYFARRPHNVFRALIDFYSQPKDIVLDCFCGGGVSVVEGLIADRRPIGCDLNPIAAFVTECQLLDVDVEEFQVAMKELTKALSTLTAKWYQTICRKCRKVSPVRWFEAAYVVKCPHCAKATSLAHSFKAKRGDDEVNGLYSCRHCKREFASAETKRIDYEILNVRYKCHSCDKQYTVKASRSDQALAKRVSRSFESQVNTYGLWYPTTEIPEYWDRQSEDLLHRKGFRRFSDLFTKRNLLFTAHYLNLVKSYRGKIENDLYKMLLFTFSATLRYTNSLTFSTASWMDGRPVAWAKHAFWVPNQFVEVNPFEYVDKRIKAIVYGIKLRKEIIPRSKKAHTFSALLENAGTHIVWNRSSEALALPDNSVSLVITDPPYGSNVQYGELTSFWTVWLADELKIDRSFLENKHEIVVHRKVSKEKSYRKDFNDYYIGLYKVFKECYRVLKPNCPLVFTFNNKELPAWYAVLKAATKAGFYLDPAGIIFQESIEIYKDTSHLRYAGALQGDFIYTFVKLSDFQPTPITLRDISTQIKDTVMKAASKLASRKSMFSTNELYVEAMRGMIPLLAAATYELSLDEAVKRFGHISIEETALASSKFSYRDGAWTKKQ